MSQSIPFREIAGDLPRLRGQLRNIKEARAGERWALADQIRKEVLSRDAGMKITISKDGKVSLWHWPSPPFSDQYHYANYGEFIANSEEDEYLKNIYDSDGKLVGMEEQVTMTRDEVLKIRTDAFIGVRPPKI